MPRGKTKSEHYVNNKEFLNAIVIYRNQCLRAEEAGEPRPRITNYLGECFVKIATHLSYKPNFVNYMFREDMISDGIENCVQYIHNFDPEKSKNPFAYFTQIIHYAFLRRIQKEKKQLEIKTKIIERSGYEEVFTVDGDMTGTSSDYNQIKDSVQTRMNYQWRLLLLQTNILVQEKTQNYFMITF